MRILVTGATGRVGGQAVAQLARLTTVRPKALTRNPAATVPGAEVIAEAGPHVFLRSSGFAANTLAWAPQLQRSATTPRRSAAAERSTG